MSTQSKAVIFILDGLGDRPHPELSGKTPLQAAETPYLDRLASRGQSGLMDPLFPGVSVDTHTGVGILFGIPPEEAIRLCRGPIEAAGIGLELLPGDVLFRANLATFEEHGGGYTLWDRRAGRITQGVDALCDSLQNIEVGKNIYASLYPATQHRCVLRLRGPELSDRISDTDPGGQCTRKEVLICTPKHVGDKTARITADAVNVFTQKSHAILMQHVVNTARSENGHPPANGVITRGVGTYHQYRNLLTRLDLKVAVVAGESTILGLANLFDFTSITHQAFTSLPDTDLHLKIHNAREALSTHDMVYLHIKGTDTAAHDKNPRLKRDLISRFDRALSQADFGDTVLAVCADHSTDSVRGEHNGDGVPALIYHKHGRRDPVQHYNEIDCTQGALNRLTAQSFLISVLDAMDCLDNPKRDCMEYLGYETGA